MPPTLTFLHYQLLHIYFSTDTQETRQSRKRSKSQQSRGSRSSRSNSTSKINLQGQEQQQPEYINISSLEDSMSRNQSDLSVVNHPTELIQKAEWNKRAIGPDAWYNDDFNFDKAQHSFANDPLLKQQYGQLLDMRYNVGYIPQENGANQVQQMQHETAIQMPNEQLMEHKPLVPSTQGASRSTRSNTWHGDRIAAELQILERKNDQPALLQVKDDSTNQHPAPRRSLDSSKEQWSPKKAIDEIRKVKEAPPKNVVQDRLKKFEGKSDEETFSMSDISNALEEAQKEAEDRQKKHSKIVSDFALSDSKDSSDGNSRDDLTDSDPNTPKSSKQQGKRSVSELLNDFEKKSQQIQEEEKKMVMKTTGESGTRRRVFSDTETMMYDTSSDENDSTFDPPAAKQSSLEQAEQSRKTSLPSLLPSQNISEVSPNQPGEAHYTHMYPGASQENQYLSMTPPLQRKPSDIVSVSSISSSQQQEERQKRPSQSVVMEHLMMEFGPERAKAIMESFNKDEMTVKNSSGSPNYQEIEDSPQKSESTSHYEYLFKATSNDAQDKADNYESVYQEIPDEQPTSQSNINKTKSPEMLPDIIGNAPAGRGHSSSDADDEGSKDQHSRSLFEVSDTFTPASFYLDKRKKSSESQVTIPTEVLGSINSLSSRELPQTPNEDVSSLTSQNRNRMSDDEVSRRDSLVYSKQQQQQQTPMKYQTHTLLKQDINFTYQSVYENDDIGFTSSSSTDQLATTPKEPSQQKVPYYVSDIKRSEASDCHSDPSPQSNLTQVKKRRAQTPDSFLLEKGQQQTQGPTMNQDGVARSKSLEGLLGDGPACPRDSVQVNMHYPNPAPTSPSVTSSYRSTPLPARGHDPPPPPEGVPPLDLSSYWNQQQQRRPIKIDDGTADDEAWRESLRRASARVKKSPEHTLPPQRPIASSPGHATLPHNQTPQNSMAPYINGYVWDQREQRFYRLNADPTSPPNPRLFQQPFLDQGLPIHTNSDSEARRIKLLMQQQRPMSVGPVSNRHSVVQSGSNSMMGRPSSTLPTSHNQSHSQFSNAPTSAQNALLYKQSTSSQDHHDHSTGELGKK